MGAGPMGLDSLCCSAETSYKGLTCGGDVNDVITARQRSYSISDLQGSWYRSSDGALIGEVHGFEVVWVLAPRPPTAPSQPPGGKDYIITKTQGYTIYGIVNIDAQASISWSNGDVWLRK
ncbi:unnamed protein product [Durusdinium trenchii]|uniref:Uncharacterized protein n=2 Tax=Durusdinium trenchii TaxID=1381693 RepID=A0ABP0LGI1_9DINO